jgi:phosphate starvation-inducible protein PhoH
VNLENKIVIIDEAQNFTTEELKKVLTRIHDSCKVIVVGHTGQVDISGRSGFARYIQHFSTADRCEVCELTINHRGWLSSYADNLKE